MPLILLVLAIAMLIIYVRGWRGWSGGGKVYYGLLTLSAVAIVVVLGMWGMLTAILA